MDPIIATIILFGGNFAPRGWAFCDGQLLSIAQYTALFSILGTTFGGNGQTTFGLPDLRGRVPMHPGNGPGLTPRTLGEQLGTETVTLLAGNVPSHTHAFLAASAPSDDDVPAGLALAGGEFYSSTAPTVPLNSATIAPNSGGSSPVQIMQPALAINYIIALEGIFPSRN
jgi:microcystin-dependent protein